MVPSPLKKFLLCAAVAAAVSLSVSCEKDRSQAEWWQGEQERIEVSQQLELKNYRFGQVYTEDFEELEGLRLKMKSATSSLRLLRQQQLALSDEVASMEGMQDEFRASTIREQRHRAVGSSFETIRLVCGRTFEKVKVSAIDDAGVTIRHADGSARLRFADLSAEQQVIFGLEADLAIAATGREAGEAAEYERWVDGRMAVLDEQQKADRATARLEDQAAREERSQLASQKAMTSSTRALAQPATTTGSRSWGYSRYYSGYRTYRPTYRNVYYSTPSYQNDFQSAVSVRAPFPQFTRSTGTGCASPVVLPKCQSFADTATSPTP
jgi:hypothetical protein